MGRVGIWAVDRYRSFRKFCRRPPVSAERIRRMRKLYPSEKPEEILRKLDGEKVSRIGMVFLAGGFLCGTIWWFGKREEPIAVLERPDYGRKEVVYELEAEKEDGVRFPVEVAVPEQTLTREEAERRMEEAYEEICFGMLGENENAGHVDQNLELPEKALGGLVQAEWSSKTREVFNDWGELTKRPGARPAEGETGIYEIS